MIIPLVIDSNIKKEVLEFVNNSDESLWTTNSAGKNRKFCALNSFNIEITKIVKDYSSKVYSYFEIDNIMSEPMFGNFIGFQTNEAYVHEHLDEAPNGLHHIRLNFLLSKPEQGGMPVINGIEYKVNEDEAWFNWANKYYHFSTPVFGNKKRLVLSLGALITEDDVNKIIAKCESLS
jgi:hypothetical protein